MTGLIGAETSGLKDGFPRVSWSPSWAPFLDIDGTLLDLAGHPMEVVVPPGLIEVLDAVRARCGCLALVTGRTLEHVDLLFGAGRFDAAASHGAVIRSGGRVWEAIAGSQPTHRVAGGLAAVVERHPGTLLEDKGHSIALHYRHAPAAAATLRQAAESAIAADPGAWRLLSGKSVFEIAPAGASKGTAIEALMAEPAYKGKLAFFAGDDTTDEDGFAVVARAGGVGVLVGQERPTSAGWRVDSPNTFRKYLADSVGRPI